MGRTKKVTSVIEETKKKETKVEVIESKKQVPMKKRAYIEDVELERIVEDYGDYPTSRIAPTLRMNRPISTEPLEIDLQDVPIKKIEDDSRLYSPNKGGDYSPKDNYQIAGAKGAYEESLPRQVGSSMSSNFSTSSLSSPNVSLSNDPTGYPGEMQQNRQYESDIEKRAKEERNRTM